METSQSDGVSALLEQARAGDPEAFGELCRAHETGLLRQAVALCGDVTLAEDLAQETLVEAWRCLARYNGRCRFFTWLCAILLHRYRNTLRRKRPLTFASLVPSDQVEGENGVPQWADDQAWPDEATQQREQAALVRHCLQALPRKHQQVVYLRFYLDNSLEEIAAALGCSVGTVKSRLFYALEKLRKMRQLRAQDTNLNQEDRAL